MNYDWKRFVYDANRTITVFPIKVEGSVAEYQDARSAAFLLWECNETKVILLFCFLENILQIYIQRLQKRGFRKRK